MSGGVEARHSPCTRCGLYSAQRDRILPLLLQLHEAEDAVPQGKPVEQHVDPFSIRAGHSGQLRAVLFPDLAQLLDRDRAALADRQRGVQGKQAVHEFDGVHGRIRSASEASA